MYRRSCSGVSIPGGGRPERGIEPLPNGSRLSCGRNARRRSARALGYRYSTGAPRGFHPPWARPSASSACSAAAGTHPSEECALPPAGHGPHKQSERARKARRSRGLTPIVPQTHHYKVVGWNDDRVLTARTPHEIRVTWHREDSAVGVKPEKRSVNGTLIRDPRGRGRTHEVYVSLRENALPVP